MKKTKYEKQIDEIVKLADKQRGFVTELARQLTKLTGATYSRQQVSQWLKSNPSERIVPNAITAEYLIQAAEATRGIIAAKQEVKQ